jgi:hypothetical protein
MDPAEATQQTGIVPEPGVEFGPSNHEKEMQLRTTRCCIELERLSGFQSHSTSGVGE